jgi:hypothetical protein
MRHFLPVDEDDDEPKKDVACKSPINPNGYVNCNLAEAMEDFENHSSTREPSVTSHQSSYSARSLKFKKTVHDDVGAGYSSVPHHRFEKHVSFVEEDKEFEKHDAEVDFYQCLHKTISKGLLYVEFWFDDDPRKILHCVSCARQNYNSASTFNCAFLHLSKKSTYVDSH